MSTYDALLVVSFGGPEGIDDVMPFLENVTRGREVPKERLALVAEHYYHRGGISPINGHNRELIAKLEPALAVAGHELPVYWGNRNWHPLLTDTVAQMQADGVQRAIAFVTSAFSSYSGCRQYREDIARALDVVEPDAMVVDKLRVFYDHPGFIGPMVDNVREAAASVAAHNDVRVAFTAHSIPLSMAEQSQYVSQLTEACRLVAAGADIPAWELVYQSRSGPPQMPWLEPDICDHIGALADDGADAVVVVPIGFVSDHMEVIQDLDTEAAAAAASRGLAFARASTVGTDDRFIRMIIDLVEERSAGADRQGLGSLGLMPDMCAADCCPAPKRRPRPA